MFRSKTKLLTLVGTTEQYLGQSTCWKLIAYAENPNSKITNIEELYLEQVHPLVAWDDTTMI